MDSGSGNAQGAASSADAAKTTPTSGDANNRQGCGCVSATTITIRVTPTTGGQFDLSISKSETIENLKKVISKKLKVPKERICLLHRDRQLRDGTLQENQLMDGSRLTLLPSVETGLLAQRPEQSVMQALESLNDAQVNDFLSGKAPLNLTMRLGDHMMLIQLQLSTVTPSSSRRTAAPTAAPTASTHQDSVAAATTSASHSSLLTPRNYLASSLSDVISGMAKNLSTQTKSSSSNSLKISTSSMKRPATTKPSGSSSNKIPFKSTKDSTMEFGSSFCPSDLPSSSRTPDATSPAKPAAETSSSFKPLTTLLTNSSANDTDSSKTFSTQFHPSILKSLELATKRLEAGESATTTASEKSAAAGGAAVATTTVVTTTTGCKCEPPVKPVLDTRALAEASRNLTQTLKQLSSEVLTSRTDPAEDTARARRQGAIIESMHHHGKGVYSGTFSGTLNPALQDRYGRPKRDISTIIHILNDLLCATPQYRRHARQGATITVETGAAKPDKEEVMEFGEDSLLKENQATRGKLEHLRLIMEERRARRRARRDARSAPYTTQWSAKSETLNAGPVTEPMEAADSDLCEMNPSGPVVA